jgi:hypothetical protein
LFVFLFVKSYWCLEHADFCASFPFIGCVS